MPSVVHIRWVARASFVLCFAFTCWAAFTPPGSGPSLFPWDKAEHFCAFVTLMVIAMVAFPAAPLWLLAAALSGFGAAIELIQALPFVHRDAEVGDWVADTLGVVTVLGVVLAWIIRRAGDEGRPPPG